MRSALYGWGIIITPSLKRTKVLMYMQLEYWLSNVIIITSFIIYPYVHISYLIIRDTRRGKKKSYHMNCDLNC